MWENIKEKLKLCKECVKFCQKVNKIVEKCGKKWEYALAYESLSHLS